MVRKKNRGNGQGTVVKVKTNCYKAIVTVGYKDGDPSKPIRRTKSGFTTKAEAYEYIPILKRERTERDDVTLKEAFDRWLPTHKASAQTIDCYKAGFKVFEDCWYISLSNQDIDELQDCIDNCSKGIRTKQNGKVALNLVYKWAIPRGLVQNNLNLASFLKCGSGRTPDKHAFTPKQLEIIKKGIGVVPFAEYIYCHCYLGFRPTALLQLTRKDYNDDEKAFIGGIKTEAGKNRTVTISPKIQPYIDDLIARCNGAYVFGINGQPLTDDRYRNIFYETLERLGIQNKEDHTLTPHCCRHTFATLMKNIVAPDKDKLELIGHTDVKQLQYYQDVNYEDLRKITDKL